MIQKQYDQLLEICEQTKAEVAVLSKDIDETDFTRSLEIEKTNDLIASIEQEIQANKQVVYETEIKNRYQQLYAVYETTKKEVAILENLLQNSSLDQAGCEDINHDDDQLLNEIKNDEISASNQMPEPKRERLNLRTSAPSLNLPRPFDSEEDSVKASLENLENMTYMPDKQTTKTTHRLESQTNMQGPALPETIMPETPIEASLNSEVLEEPIHEPAMSEAPESVTSAPTMSETSGAPGLPHTVAKKSFPKLKTEIKKQSESNEINQKKDQATQKKAPLSEKKANRVWRIFYNVFFCFVIVFTIVFVMFFGNQDPQAIPRDVMGFSVMQVAKPSMEPEIPVNSLIVTRAIDSTDLHIGDVVTFASATHTTLTHRIHEIVEDSATGERAFIMKGDAFSTPDTEVVFGQDIIGRVIFISYPFGRALLFFQNQFLLVIAIVILIFLILFAVNTKSKNLVKQAPKNVPK